MHYTNLKIMNWIDAKVKKNSDYAEGTSRQQEVSSLLTLVG